MRNRKQLLTAVFLVLLGLIVAVGVYLVPSDESGHMLTRSQPSENREEHAAGNPSGESPGAMPGPVEQGQPEADESVSDLSVVKLAAPIHVFDHPFEFELAGRVIDLGGLGVAGAKVLACLKCDELGEPVFDQKYSQVDREQSALTVEDGSFQLRVRGSAKLALATNSVPFSLLARKEGFAPALTWVLNSAPTEIKILLVPYVAVEGRVVAEGSGEPVPYALVSYAKDERSGQMLPEGLPEGLRPVRDERIFQTTSDVHGAFRIEGLAGGVWGLAAFPSGVDIALAAKQGFGRSVQRIDVMSGTRSGVVLTLPSFHQIRFKVTNSEVSEVTVGIRTNAPHDPKSYRRWKNELPVFRATNEHQFSGPLPANGVESIVLSSEGYLPKLFPAPVEADGVVDLGEVTFQPKALVRVQVVNPAGKGISGAFVSLYRSFELSKINGFAVGDDFGHYFKPVGQTDEAGYLTLPALGEGDFRVQGLAPGYPPVVADFGITPHSAENREITLVLEAGGTIFGTWTSSGNTDASPTGQAKCFPADRGLAPSIGTYQFSHGGGMTYKLESGKPFEFSGVAVGEQVLVVRQGDNLFCSTVFKVAANQRTEVIFEYAGARVYGTVLGTDGRPLAQHEVYLSALGVVGYGQNEMVKSDGNGAYEFTGVKKGEWFVLLQDDLQRYGSGQSGGYPALHLRRVEVTEREGYQLNIDLSSVAGAAVGGRFLMNGKPYFDKAYLSFANKGLGIGGRSLDVAGDGTFSLGKIPFGLSDKSLSISASREGDSQDWRVTVRRLQHTAESPLEPINIDFRAHQISGRVVGLPEGVRAESALISAFHNPAKIEGYSLGNQNFDVPVDKDGRFSIPNCLAGSLQLTLKVSGRLATTTQIHVDGDKAGIEIAAGGTPGQVKVKISTPDLGPTVDGVIVSWDVRYPDGKQIGSSQRNNYTFWKPTNDSFVFENLPLGAGKLTIWAAGYASATTSIVVRDIEPDTYQVVLRRSPMVEFRVNCGDDAELLKPLLCLHITPPGGAKFGPIRGIFSIGDGGQLIGSTDVGGEGEYTFTLSAEGYEEVSQSLRLAFAENVMLNLTLSKSVETDREGQSSKASLRAAGK